MPGPLAAGGADKIPSIEVSGILGATSDYVYRGVSLRDEAPTPFAYISAKLGTVYLDGFLIGAELGNDALGRGLGTIEADVTLGVRPRIEAVEFNLGARYTAYPNGRDLIAGTLEKAERDFIEPFAGATVHVTEQLSFGGTLYWTPDYFYETGRVVTVEGHVGLVLPSCGALSSKLTAFGGRAKSEQPFVVSPGDSYVYYNVGVEAQVERMLFDFRYWSTDVDGFRLFDPRFVVSAGVAF